MQNNYHYCTRTIECFGLFRNKDNLSVKFMISIVPEIEYFKLECYTAECYTAGIRIGNDRALPHHLTAAY